MTETKNSNPLLVLMAAIALALLLGGGFLFYKNSKGVDDAGTATANAGAQADKAVAAAGMSASERAATEALVLAVWHHKPNDNRQCL